MIMINTYYPQRFPKQQGGIDQLKDKIDQHHELKKYKHLLIKALTGKYKTAGQMRQDLFAQINRKTVGKVQSKKQQQPFKTRGSKKQKVNQAYLRHSLFL